MEVSVAADREGSPVGAEGKALARVVRQGLPDSLVGPRVVEQNSGVAPSTASVFASGLTAIALSWPFPCMIPTA